MSATLSFSAGLLTGVAAMLGVIIFRRAPQVASAMRRSRTLRLTAGIAAGAVALAVGTSFVINVHRGAAGSADDLAASDGPPPPMPPPGEASTTSGMPSAAAMSRILALPRGARGQMAEPMDQAAAGLATRLERQGGTAADWNLLAQAYDFLGRTEDAQRARARAAEVGAIQRTR
jgi:hypothetical protein